MPGKSGRSQFEAIAHAGNRVSGCRPNHRQEHRMLDIVMLAIGLGFFAAALAYVAGCERL